jgi:hypothetical protein
VAARIQAEELVVRELVLLMPEDPSDEDDESASGGELQPVVNRSHPSWADIEAQQRERAGSQAGAVVSQAVTGSGVFWVALIAGLMVVYIVPTVIGIIQRVESLGLVIIMGRDHQSTGPKRRGLPALKSSPSTPVSSGNLPSLTEERRDLLALIFRGDHRGRRTD